MQGKYCNFMPGVPSMLHHCIADRLWIRQQRRWWSPYQWADKFGHVFQGMNWEPTLADPVQLIAQARQDISEGKPLAFPSQTGIRAIAPVYVSTDRALIALDKFEKRVHAYYAGDWDARLIRSLETGRWY